MMLSGTKLGTSLYCLLQHGAGSHLPNVLFVCPKKIFRNVLYPRHWFRKKMKNPLGLPIFNMMSLHNGISHPETPLLSLFQSGFDAECFNSLSAHYEQGLLESIYKVHDNTSVHELKTYCSLKTQFGMENYARGIPLSERRHFTKLKISAHHLSIEWGRYTRPITPRSQRYCSDCKEES